MEKHYRLTLCELVQRVREGRVTCAEIMRSHLARCAEMEPAVQAWQYFDAERAMERAEAADAVRARGDPAGPLEGVPLGIKDIIDVAGMPTSMGSAIHRDNVVQSTAQCVAQLEAAGAIVLGKTVSTEFAYYTPGKTRNPWNGAHTPGGSSSGSAAAVACGMAAGAIGTQTNGSVIRPAAFCGIVGFKPSFGTVSNHGTLDPWPSLDHTGVFARRVADAALLASIIVEPTRAISSGLPTMERPRLAAVRSPVWHLAQAEQRAMLAANIEALREAGAQVAEEELPPPFADAHAAMRVIMAYEAARHFRTLQAQHRSQLSARFNALLDEGHAVVPARYEESLAQARALRAAYAEFMARYDAVITPPAPGEAPRALDQTGDPAFCTIWSLLGAPAVTIPVGLGPNGVPLGLQVVAKYGEDDAALAVAAWCERQLPFGLETVRRQA